MEREALKLALEKIERFITKQGYFDDFADEITAIKEALAQLALEPVAWMYPDALCDRACLYVCTKAFTQFPECATAPPQRPWLEPTGNEWFEWWRVSNVAHETEVEIDFADFLIIAQAVVAKLKDKNNGT